MCWLFVHEHFVRITHTAFFGSLSTYSTDTWEDETDDVHIPTTGAVEQRLIDLKELKGLKKVTGVMQRDQEWDATVTDDDHVATTDAIVERLDHELGSTSC